jgi:hypothetical protein
MKKVIAFILLFISFGVAQDKKPDITSDEREAIRELQLQQAQVIIQIQATQSRIDSLIKADPKISEAQVQLNRLMDQNEQLVKQVEATIAKAKSVAKADETKFDFDIQKLAYVPKPPAKGEPPKTANPTDGKKQP